ncbi:hypothetical protein G7Z17_g12458 [Cylindrodendrum hubeiense]|uniref:C2H2-type domain-containing protein n=1 Tax=Cylindrodendrum hubeiense TaxID=595255 RepID=A0A9P5GYA9_9HYPO|nr:hypothetical protein G7Z17_g12458 [Cylindrodendrum hubeiense]
MGGGIYQPQIVDDDSSVHGVGSWADIPRPPLSQTDVEQADPEPQPKSPVENQDGVLDSWVRSYSENYSHSNRLVNNDIPPRIPVPTRTALPSLTQQDTMSTRSVNAGYGFPIRQENGRLDSNSSDSSDSVLDQGTTDSEVETAAMPDPSWMHGVTTTSTDYTTEYLSESVSENSTERSKSTSAASSPSTDASPPPSTEALSSSTEASPSPESVTGWNDYDPYISSPLHIGDGFSASSTASSPVIPTDQVRLPNQVIVTMASSPESSRSSPEPEVSSSRQTEGDKGQASTKGQKKRPLDEVTGNSHNNEDQVDTNQAKRKKNEDRQLTPLACPFYKKDPIVHKRCHGYLLTRISYVKQHLFRHHLQPLHCPVCMDVFDNDESRDGHIRAQSCKKRPAEEQPDGMTSTQEKQLRAKRANQKQSEEEQWYEIFNLLFPDTERPSSPYMINSLSEDMSSFREFVERQGGKIVQKGLIDKLPSGMMDDDAVRSVAYAAVQDIFSLWWKQSFENYPQRRVNSNAANKATGTKNESQNKNGTEIHSGERSRKAANGPADVGSNGISGSRTTSNRNGGSEEAKSNGGTGSSETANNGTQTSTAFGERARRMSTLSMEASSNATDLLSHVSTT